MEKWNSKIAKELGIDENLLNSVNVAVKAGRQELDALVNDVAREEQYKAACKDIDDKRRECLESDLKVYVTPHIYTQMFFTPLLGWAETSIPEITEGERGLWRSFMDLDPLMRGMHGASKQIHSEDSFFSLFNSLGGVYHQGLVRWVVENEDDVYSGIAKLNQVVLESVAQYNKNADGNKIILKLHGCQLEIDTVCSALGIKEWESAMTENFKDGDFCGPNDEPSFLAGLEKDKSDSRFRYDVIESMYHYPEQPWKRGGGPIDRRKIVEEIFFSLYPEKANDLTLKAVLETLSI